MIPPYTYKIFTVKDPHASVPFTGLRFTKEAPGGWGIYCRQRRVSLTSYRPLYQAVLDAELTLMAEIAFRLRQQFNTKPRQLRVDGAVFQLPKKHAKRLAEWADETWAAGKRFKASQLEADSRTLIEVGCFHPVSAAGAEPVPTGPWQDLSLDEAAARMEGGESIALLGQGGTGKKVFANQQAQHLSCRVYAVCKTHVGVAGLKVENATKCTLAALQRRYVALGAIEVPSGCIADAT